VWTGAKLVSLIEAHADIIVEGARHVQYGHNLNLLAGKSGLILAWVSPHRSLRLVAPPDRRR
jgi:hypothetical protein